MKFAPTHNPFVFAILAAALGGLWNQALAQQAVPLPENLTERDVIIWSEGQRMAGDLFVPKNIGPNDKLPAILMSHGWGGTKALLRRNAIRFASNGFIVLAFDYRGWGDSESRIMILGDAPRTETGEADVRVRMVRNVVDPFAQLVDIRRALDWLEGEPNVDANRIGYWGSSYSGGHAVWLAAHEPRVKCAVAQVPAASSRSIPKVLYQDESILETAKKRAIARARGEIDPYPGEADKAPRLTGWAVMDNVFDYNPVDDAGRITIPLLVIDAENEELFDRHTSGEPSAQKAKANGAPAEYYVVKGITHYGVYTERFEEVTKLAEDWFNKHLKK